MEQNDDGPNCIKFGSVETNQRGTLYWSVHRAQGAADRNKISSLGSQSMVVKPQKTIYVLGLAVG